MLSHYTRGEKSTVIKYHGKAYWLVCVPPRFTQNVIMHREVRRGMIVCWAKSRVQNF